MVCATHAAAVASIADAVASASETSARHRSKIEAAHESVGKHPPTLSNPPSAFGKNPKSYAHVPTCATHVSSSPNADAQVSMPATTSASRFARGVRSRPRWPVTHTAEATHCPDATS